MGFALFKKDKYNVYEAAARQRRNLLAGEDRAVRRMLGAYRVAEKSIEKRLASVIAKIAAAKAAGVDVSPAWLHQQSRFRALLKTIRYEVDKFARVAAGVTVAQQKAAIATGTKAASELVRAAGVRSDFVMLPRGAFTDVVGHLTDKSPLHDLFKTLGPSAVAVAREVFAEEIAAGSHPYVIARRLRRELAMTERRAVLIARTESLRAYRTAQLRNYENNSDVVTGWRWTSARDSRTCAICWAMDGKIFQHGETLDSHPACRCAPTPVVIDLDKDRGTGEAALQQRTEHEQRQILGKRRYELWKEGKVSLSDLVEPTNHIRWGRGRKLKRLSQLPKAQAKPAAAPPLPKAPAPAPTLPTPPPPIAPTVNYAELVLDTEMGPQRGSNPGGLYMGKDGVKRYVKFYADPAQARVEHLANRIYNALGVDAPDSLVFEHNGKTVFASTIIENEGTLDWYGLDKQLAERVLEGFPVDVLTANWDAIGASLDNVVVVDLGNAGLGVARIDQGGALLFRAQGSRKPVAALGGLAEFETFLDAGLSTYARVFEAAGISDAAELGEALAKRIDSIVAMQKDWGGWRAFVKAAGKDADGVLRLAADDLQRVAAMLDERTALLKAKAAEIRATIAKRKAAQVLKGSVKSTPGKGPVLRWTAKAKEFMRKLDRLGSAAWHSIHSAGGQAEGVLREWQTMLGRWTGSSTNEVAIAMHDAVEEYMTGAIANPAPQGYNWLAGQPIHRERVDAAKAMFASRRQRWEVFATQHNIKVPRSFQLYRGVSNSEAVDYVIAAWADETTDVFVVPQRRLASWSLDRQYAAENFASMRPGAISFDGAVLYEAEIPFELTWADKIVDDGEFMGTYGSEQEVIAGGPTANHITTTKDRVTVAYRGRIYTYAERRQLFAAWKADGGRVVTLGDFYVDPKYETTHRR